MKLSWFKLASEMVQRGAIEDHKKLFAAAIGHAEDSDGLIAASAWDCMLALSLQKEVSGVDCYVT